MWNTKKVISVERRERERERWYMLKVRVMGERGERGARYILKVIVRGKGKRSREELGIKPVTSRG